jgi:hypothetical protein
MAYITRIPFRHLHAIRDQVVGSLGMIFNAMRSFKSEDWLSESAPVLLPALRGLKSRGDVHDLFLEHDERDGRLVQNYAMLLNYCLMNHEAIVAAEEAAMQTFVTESYKSTSGSDHPAEDYHGTDLGGEWDIPGFIIRSGVVLSLGALEEFERGTLRILCSWKDSRRNGVVAAKLIYPRLADYKRSSPGWEAAERARKTETVGGRHSMMRRFGIDADLRTEWNARIRQMRTDRNTIAHGKQAISHPLQSFLQLHYDIFAAVCDISRQSKLSCGIVL